jgi:zinc transport system substrate-binding protein
MRPIQRIVRAGQLSALAVLLGCQQGPDPKRTVPQPNTNGELEIYVVNYPLQYFAERVGGDTVNVRFPAPDNGDPAFWSPSSEVITAYQAADLIVINGAGYAKWVELATLPLSKVIDTSGPFKESYILADRASHVHGPEGEHEHGEIAFTTWLDPLLAVEQSRAVLDALVRLRPDDASTFKARFDSLEADLLALDERLQRVAAALSDQPLLASHPVYQYLARRYDLDLRSVHFEPDEFPGDAAWEELEALLGERAATWMLWEAPPLAQTAQRLGERGVESVVFDPCGSPPESGDFISVMMQNVSNLETVLSPRGG